MPRPCSLSSFGTSQPKKMQVSVAPVSSRIFAASHSSRSKIVSSASAGMKPSGWKPDHAPSDRIVAMPTSQVVLIR